MDEEKLNDLIAGCKDGNTTAQHQLFNYMYDYGMNIAIRYGQTLAESEDIANEGFYKALKNIQKHSPKVPFLLWVRRIIINCGIDQYRKSKTREIENIATPSIARNDGAQTLDSDYLLEMIRKLSPQYRMIFVLHSIEGYSHAEIAQKLNISRGTSKSNLSKARVKLQEMVKIYNQKTAHVTR